jgi:hypothetical protein
MKYSAVRVTTSPEALVLLIYSGIALTNYITVLLTGFYTGDFLWGRQKLSAIELFLNFLYTLLPLLSAFILYKIYVYKIYGYLSQKDSVPLSLGALGIYLFIAYFFSIFVSVRYNVGLFGSDGTYNVPAWLRLFIIFTNRLSPSLGMYLYCLSAPKKNKLKYLFMAFAVILGITRASLSPLFQVLMVFILMKYDGNFFQYVKRAAPLLALLLVLLSFFSYDLFQFREKLRSGGTDTYTATVAASPMRLIFGRILGRLSSYSASAWLLEKRLKYEPLAEKKIAWYQFPLEAIPIPRSNREFRYGHILVGKPGNSFKSPGASGALTIGYYHSVHAFFVNIVTMTVLTAVTFHLSLLFRNKNIRVIFFLLICGGLVEGSAWILANAVQYTVMYIFFFLVVNSFARWIRRDT